MIEFATKPSQEAEFPRAPSFVSGGHLVDLLAPSTADIDFEQIAYTLAKLGRWAEKHDGATYSVAQHSVVGADYLWKQFACHRTALAFLIHDAHEGCGIGDVATPVMKALDALFQDAQRGIYTTFPNPSALMAQLKAKWDVRICQSLPIDPYVLHPEPNEAIKAILGAPLDHDATKIARRVKDMDATLCQAEAHVLFGRRAAPRPESFEKLTGLSQAWGAEKAREEWLERLQRFGASL